MEEDEFDYDYDEEDSYLIEKEGEGEKEEQDDVVATDDIEKKTDTHLIIKNSANRTIEMIPNFNIAKSQNVLPKDLRIVQWNINSLVGKRKNFQFMLDHLQPDVITLNETKLTKINEEAILKNDLYYACHKRELHKLKVRRKGTAIFVKHTLKYKRDKSFDQLGLSLMAIRLEMVKYELLIIAYYANDSLNTKLFEMLKSEKHFILLGDLNIPTSFTSMMINNDKFKVINNIQTPTSDHNSVLDLCIASEDVQEYITEVEVIKKCSWMSDHYPLKVEIQGILKYNDADIYENTNTIGLDRLTEFGNFKNFEIIRECLKVISNENGKSGTIEQLTTKFVADNKSIEKLSKCELEALNTLLWTFNGGAILSVYENANPFKTISAFCETILRYVPCQRFIYLTNGHSNIRNELPLSVHCVDVST